ncbi:hypothetical protein B0H14DRAFT_2615717 [Mycena olivaceomarginata]|nr:hypothetical protein B0H14DRAFT_2615717 [Mycena olivaceomarginata]
MYRAWQGMYRAWNVWGGTSFVNPGLAAIGVHASNALVTAGPGVAGLGHVLTLLTGIFTECIGWKQWAGLALFVIRISMEMIAEDSRKKFRKDPKNKGKIDDTGLWYILFYPRSRVSDLVFFDIRLMPTDITTTATGLPCLNCSTRRCLICNLYLWGEVPEISGYMATKYDAQ